ncbi:hypothetical protein FRC08_016838 [Ceratobasidium sp. 394]|nr:hypothetical protein FRC08_016838 [Ceratobasidium sp. 394]
MLAPKQGLQVLYLPHILIILRLWGTIYYLPPTSTLLLIPNGPASLLPCLILCRLRLWSPLPCQLLPHLCQNTFKLSPGLPPVLAHGSSSQMFAVWAEWRFMPMSLTSSLNTKSA